MTARHARTAGLSFGRHPRFCRPERAAHGRQRRESGVSVREGDDDLSVRPAFGDGGQASEYQVMAMLSMEPGRTLRMSRLAALTSGSLTRLSRVVDRLDKRGWVCRRPDPTDGRSTLAALTDAGWDKVVETAPGHVTEVRRLIFDQLTRSQVRQLDRIGSRVLRTIGAEGLAPRRQRADARRPGASPDVG